MALLLCAGNVGHKAREEAAKTSFSRNMLDVIPKGQWELRESRPRSLHCALTSRLMLKKGDS